MADTNPDEKLSSSTASATNSRKRRYQEESAPARILLQNSCFLSANRDSVIL